MLGNPCEPVKVDDEKELWLRFSVCPPRLVHLSQDAFILFDRINGFIASQFFGCNPLLLKTGLQFMERLMQLFELLKIYILELFESFWIDDG